MRVVRRQKVTSASLFDQRRMMRNHGAGGAGGAGGSAGNAGGISGGNARGGEESKRGKYSSVPRNDSMETIELTRNIMGNGIVKVPKSPAPQLQTV